MGITRRIICSAILVGTFMLSIAYATLGIWVNVIDRELPFAVYSTGKYIKLWVRCESDAPIFIRIADKNGNTVAYTDKETLHKGEDYTFYWTRPDNYSDQYYAYMWTQEGDKASAWYHSISYDSLSDAGDEATNWNKSSMISAQPSQYQFYVNNQQVNLAAYEIGGNNYVKLRDIASALNETSKQFDVEWVAEKNLINLLSDAPYLTVGGELQPLPDGIQDAKRANATIYKDGKPVNFSGYLVNGNNFYMLRDIADCFNFAVTWDNAKHEVNISTDNGYEEESTRTQNENEPNGAGNNDNFDDAQEIMLDSLLIGLLQSEKDIDCYKFVAPLTGKIQIYLGSLPDKSRPVKLEIFDLGTSESPQASQMVAESSKEILISPFSVKQGHTYHIRLTISGASLYTNYILNVETK